MSGFGFRISGEGFLKKKKQRERNERERDGERGKDRTKEKKLNKVRKS